MTGIIAFLATKLGALGIPEPLRKAAAWAALIIAAIALLWAAKTAYDASVIDEHEQERSIEAIEAREQAASERAADTITATTNDKDRNDAITSAPTGGALSPAERALNCERLRQLGRVPAACRPSGSDGAEADTGR